MRLALTHAYPFPCPPDSYTQAVAADKCQLHTLTLDNVSAFAWSHVLSVTFESVEATLEAKDATGWAEIGRMTLIATISRAEGYDSHPAVVVDNTGAIVSEAPVILTPRVAFCGFAVTD